MAPSTAGKRLAGALVRENEGVRPELRSFLENAGVTEEELQRATREGWLPLLTLDRLAVPERPKYDVTEIAARAGASEELLHRLWRAVGFPDVAPGIEVFNDSDVAAARLVLNGAMVRGSDFATLLRHVRVISASMARIASVLAEHFSELVGDLREQGLDDETIAFSLMESFDGENLGQLLVYEARLQLRAALWLRLARDAAPDLAVAIGFADLSGFTEISAELDADELALFVARWEELVYDTVASGGARVVKTIGDEAMFVGLPVQVSRIAIALRDAARAEGLPDVRAGIAAGMVVARDGDFYGPVVNLASRLTEAAPVGVVYASEGIRAELVAEPAFQWSDVGVQHLRGIGDVRVFALVGAA